MNYSSTEPAVEVVTKTGLREKDELAGQNRAEDVISCFDMNPLTLASHHRSYFVWFLSVEKIEQSQCNGGSSSQ